MSKYGLVFDCDGTLVDSLGAALDSFNYALKAIGEKPRTVEEIKKYFGAGADRIFISLLGDKEKGLAAFEAYVDHQSELALQMKLHNGILDLLKTAAAAGIPMGVVTGRHARDMDVVLRPHKIHDYFKVLIADSHLPHSKPAPDGILMAADRMGLEPQNVCYIGDSIVDIQAAKAAGAKGVAALWDVLAKEEAMRAAGADCLARTPNDVWQYFRRTFLIS